MSRGDIMMTGKRRSGWGYVVFVLLVFVVLYLARETFFRRTQAPPPPASMATVGDAVQKAYNGLRDSFREKVLLGEFAGMFHRMADPDCGGELPEIRLATVTDGTGPELPVARYRVEYPNNGAKAEYHFARIDGIWQLQSFTRIPTELPGGLKPDVAGNPGGQSSVPQPTSKVPGGATPAEGIGTQSPTPAGIHPPTPCDYIIQPGDTLSAISLHFYGTTRYWRRVMEANPGLNERNLRVGRKIRVPSNPEAAAPAPKEEADTDPRPATETP